MSLIETLTVGGAPLAAHVAQSVEHFLGKEEVTGSNPVMSSTFVKNYKCMFN